MGGVGFRDGHLLPDLGSLHPLKPGQYRPAIVQFILSGSGFKISPGRGIVTGLQLFQRQGQGVRVKQETVILALLAVRFDVDLLARRVIQAALFR